jgi:predicted MFS family arabinose efflux permease
MSSSQEVRRRDIRLVVAGTSHFFLAGVAFNVYAVVAVAIRADLALSGAQMGLLMSIASITYAVMQIPVGLLCLRLNKGLLLVGSAFLMAVGALMFSLMHSYPGLLISRAVTGIAAGFSVPAISNLLSEGMSEKRLPVGMAVFGSGWSVGAAMPFVVLSPVLAAAGWRSTMGVVAGFGVVMALLIVLSLIGSVSRPRRASETPHWNPRALGALLTNRGAIWLILIVTTTLSTQIGLVTWVPAFLQSGQMSVTVLVTMIPVVLGLAAGAASIVGGAVGARFGKFPVVAASMIGCVILPPLFIFATSIPAVFVVMILVGWSSMFWWGSGMSMLPTLVRKEHTGAAMGVINCLAWVLGGFPSPYVFGVLLDASGTYAFGFLFVGLVGVAGTVGALSWRRELQA